MTVRLIFSLLVVVLLLMAVDVGHSVYDSFHHARFRTMIITCVKTPTQNVCSSTPYRVSR